MNHDKHIAELVEKFLDGRTTNAEERELYTWFRTHDVSEEWLPLKDMFAWYEAGMPEEMVAAKPAEQRSKGRPLRLSLNRRLQIAGSCAAVLVISLLIFGGDGGQDDIAKSDEPSATSKYVAVLPEDADLMERADMLEAEAMELLAWTELQN